MLLSTTVLPASFDLFMNPPKKEVIIPQGLTQSEMINSFKCATTDTKHSSYHLFSLPN